MMVQQDDDLQEIYDNMMLEKHKNETLKADDGGEIEKPAGKAYEKKKKEENYGKGGAKTKKYDDGSEITEEKGAAPGVIKELISTSFGGSNEEQMKAVQLLKGLAVSEDPESNKFMKALDKWTSGLDASSFE